MRIKSITAKNYKIHREIRVELDPESTVIGGPNECGKSTLVQAAHRALFLKANITGEAQRAMQPHDSGGHPEVEVCFESGGKEYRIIKRFAGQSGMARLTEVGGKSFSDEEAEEELAKILGVELVGGGRGAGDRAAQQWAHLWVWQGEAGSDPTAHANAHRDSLLSRLQEVGGAAVMQSPMDIKVANQFSQGYELIFNQNGKPKAGSDLAKAEQRHAEAVQWESQARVRFQALQQSMTDYEEARLAIKSTEEALAKLRPQLEKVGEKLKEVEKLQGEEKVQHAELESAANAYNQLVERNETIKSLRKEVEDQGHAIGPKVEQAEKCQLRAAEKKKEAEKGRADWELATDLMRMVRLKKELAEAYQRLFEKKNQLEKETEKAAQINKERESARVLEKTLARLPQVDERKFRKLQELERTQSNAEATLKAMAATVEVISAAIEVNAGGKELKPGQTQVLTEDTEIVLGTVARLRISPGGGTSLTEAKMDLAQARKNLQEALDKLGLKSVAEAGEALQRRDEIQGKVKVCKASLSALGADQIEAVVAKAQEAFEHAAGEVDRRRDGVEDFQIPENSEEAKTISAQFASDLSEKEAKEKRLKIISNQLAEDAAEAEKQARNLAQALETERREIIRKKGGLDTLIQTYGADEARVGQLARLSKAKREAEEKINATRDRLRELQPEMLQKDKHRLEKAISIAEDERDQAGRKEAVAGAQLRSDGSADPAADLAMAEARLKSAKENLLHERRRAAAVKMLNELFVEEQRRFSEQLTQPLLEKVSGYLQCLFGQGTSAHVQLQDNQFTGLKIKRPGRESEACGFDQLSGGAKEQVAAAFRLAMAEVLAESHGGTLPLVFDDAFAYSDPDRVQILQRMLDLGRVRGLQIIVLTCNPVDYVGLGAKQVTFRAPITTGRRAETVSSSQEKESQPAATGVHEDSEILAEQLIAALRAGGGSKGNWALRQALGWEQERYERVRDVLVQAGRLATGRGKGGSVSLVEDQRNGPIVSI